MINVHGGGWLLKYNTQMSVITCKVGDEQVIKQKLIDYEMYIN